MAENLYQVGFDPPSETERVRSLYDKQASSYDRRVQFIEKLVFGEGRK
jgi:hypothetical protein